MAYTKTTWVDRNVQNPNRYTKTDVDTDTVDLVAEPGTVTEEGTPVNATNMNKIETGVYDAHIDIATIQSDLSSANTNIFKNSLDLAKGLFTVQSQIAAGLNSLSQMAIDVFNDENGIASKTNEDYDATNKLYKPDTAGGSAKTIVVSGVNAYISTSDKKFGSSSAYFGQNYHYICTADSADFTLGSSDFTIDFWFNHGGVSNDRVFMMHGNGTASGSSFKIYTDSSRIIYGQVFSSSTTYSVNSASAFATSTWNHVALVRSSNILSLYINGTSVGTPVDLTGVTINDNSSDMCVGNGSVLGIQGYMDEFRFSKGIARWTSNFTPPTEAYSSDSYTKLLLHMEGTHGSQTFTDSSAPYNTSMTLISNALTCSSAPTYGYIVVDDTNNSATITYYLSRDNGSTWTQVTEETLTDISGQPSGTSLKIKAVTSGGIVATPPQLKAWAWGYK